jgi:hypothetical protein
MQVLKAVIAFSAVALCAAPAAAAVTQITTPDAAYTSSTTLLPITVPDFTTLTSLSDANVTLTFDSTSTRTVGLNWSTWGSPPDTEGSTPRLLFGGLSSMTFTSSVLLAVLGFEAEPDPFSVHNFHVDYYNGATLVGSIDRLADGSAGARLMAASGGFNKAVVTSDTDFAVAQVRYSLGVPEPSTWALMIGGFGMAGMALRRRRMVAA